MNIEDKIKLIDRQKIPDSRGWFFKFLTGNEPFLSPGFGEIYFTLATSGCSRGGHYHEQAHEWFTVVSGEAIAKLKDIDSGEMLELKLDSSKPQILYVPPRIAHIFINENRSDEMLLAAYTDRKYDPLDTLQISF
jgi:dTDP-4-dehydrorhamnose 3,5-epimerase-like enzyme